MKIIPLQEWLKLRLNFFLLCWGFILWISVWKGGGRKSLADHVSPLYGSDFWKMKGPQKTPIQLPLGNPRACTHRDLRNMRVRPSERLCNSFPYSPELPGASLKKVNNFSIPGIRNVRLLLKRSESPMIKVSVKNSDIEPWKKVGYYIMVQDY